MTCTEKDNACTQEPAKPFSLWQALKDLVGKDILDAPLPIQQYCPLGELQFRAEAELEYTELLDQVSAGKLQILRSALRTRQMSCAPSAGGCAPQGQYRPDAAGGCMLADRVLRGAAPLQVLQSRHG